VQVDQDRYGLVVDPAGAVTTAQMVGERPGSLAGHMTAPGNGDPGAGFEAAGDPLMELAVVGVAGHSAVPELPLVGRERMFLREHRQISTGCKSSSNPQVWQPSSQQRSALITRTKSALAGMAPDLRVRSTNDSPCIHRGPDPADPAATA